MRGLVLKKQRMTASVYLMHAQVDNMLYRTALMAQVNWTLKPLHYLEVSKDSYETTSETEYTQPCQASLSRVKHCKTIPQQIQAKSPGIMH